jgi:LPS-assembly lipoprotein
MSWSEFWPSSRDWRIFAALLLALPAGGCFQPLYGEAAHPGLTADMQAIAVEPIGDRIGHYLGDDLIANLNGTGSTPTPKYRLTVKVVQSSSTPTVTSQLQVANAATVSATATYVLKAAGSGEMLVTDKANAAAVYDRTEDRFANLRAQRDAEIRLAKSLADEIELRLAAYLGAKK